MHSRRLSRAAFAAVLVAALSSPVFAQATEQKVDRGLRESLAKGAATQRVIITVKPGYRDQLRQALQRHGDRIKAEHPLVDALSVDLHSEDVAELAGLPWVGALSIDATVYAGSAANRNGNATNSSTSTTSASSIDWITDTLRPTLGLPRVSQWNTPSGAGVGVAVVDSGIAPIADFDGKITAFYDFTRGGIPTNPFDDYGHGTHVAGLIGASGKGSGYLYQGVAPDVHFVGLKVLDATGAGNTSDVIKALEYVTANYNRLGVHVINLSLGHPIYAPASQDPLVQAVEQAVNAGLIVVASAGNYGQNDKTGQVGYTGITSPGNSRLVITVGAAMTQNTTTRDDDVVAPYSSRGPSWYDGFAKPDVLAPGHQLISDTTASSTLYAKLPATAKVQSPKTGKPFLRLSGSSMAAAVASGVVADIIDAHNRASYYSQTALTPNAVKAILEFSAIPIANADYLTQGAGDMNAAGAIALASGIDTTGTTGDWWLRSGVAPYSAIGAHVYEWGQTVIWGDTVYTGSLVYTNLTAWSGSTTWGSNVVWSTAAEIQASNIVWSTNVVWGTNIVWSDRIVGQDDSGNIVWGTNVVWGTLTADNVVWGTRVAGQNIVWGTVHGANVVWGTSADDGNVVWGTAADDQNVVWGTAIAAAKSNQQF